MTCPSSFVARFETSAGAFLLDVHRDWAPCAARRFHALVESAFYREARFFRVMPGFVIQFGLSGDPAANERWRTREFEPDNVRQSNVRGFASFAMREMKATTQVFVNLGDNRSLDTRGFAPFGRVSVGLDVLDRVYAGYGDCPPRGNGPDQLRIIAEGQPYLAERFPLLDFIVDVSIDPASIDGRD